MRLWACLVAALAHMPEQNSRLVRHEGLAWSGTRKRKVFGWKECLRNKTQNENTLSQIEYAATSVHIHHTQEHGDEWSSPAARF
uniref:Uncharacterized protein n=1 Tax=Arundo donax TaxID=35708 RepID=A0A0A9E151_ARUDO